MPTEVIDYQIIGDDLQAVVITLDPNEAVVAEAGAMIRHDQWGLIQAEIGNLKILLSAPHSSERPGLRPRRWLVFILNQAQGPKNGERPLSFRWMFMGWG